MKNFAYFGKQLGYLFKSPCIKVNCFLKSYKTLIKSSFRILVFHVNPFWIQLVYFLILSLVGFLALKVSKPRTPPSLKPSDLDIFFTSVSTATVSSMTSVEMEVLSNTQLIIMTILMLVGGEVFTSMLELQFKRSKFSRHSLSNPTSSLELVPADDSHGLAENEKSAEIDLESHRNSSGIESLKSASMKTLGYVVLGYLLVIHMSGSSLVALYTSLVPSAREVLIKKAIQVQTFSLFTVVSTFSNCGFVPTNENMIVFKKNSGLLLLLIPQTLLGNTLYAPTLRFLIWVLEKMTKRVEYKYMLKNSREMGYSHLMSGVRCWFLFGTVLVFLLAELVVFCSMEWNSGVMDGLSWFEKLVAALFQVVSSRHSGESVFDLSTISPAILVIFVVMMYLPPYSSFLPMEIKEEEEIVKSESKNQRKTTMQCLLFSQLSYILIFIILICIVEREKMKTDPLNFNVLNITIEVISAYGNVGFSSGYSCERRLHKENWCKDKWYGFVGKWSNLGKIILIIVMFFGRLKKFFINGGKAWKLS